MSDENKYINWNDLICYQNKKIVDWSKNVGVVLYFKYNTTFHFLKICEDYGSNGKNHYLKIEFDNGIVKKVRTDHLRNLRFSKIYPKDTHKYQVGYEFNNLKIIRGFTKKRETYNWNQNVYTVKCLKDGYEFDVLEYEIDTNRSCPVCLNRKIIHGINDVATTDEWMIKYFKNKEETTLYSACSGKKVWLKCPVCGKEYFKSIELLHRNGFSCKYCSDKISYPNKFMIYILKQLEDNNEIYEFRREYSPDWAAPYKYDNYFIKDNKQYIIEMDGGLGHGKVVYGSNEIDVEGLNRDIKKDILAKEHDITLIRIDCYYNRISERFSYIKNNVMVSLQNILNLSCINWIECERFCNGNLLKEICDLYNSGMTRKELCQRFNYISNSCIGDYLHTGTRCGICNYNSSFSKKYRYIYLIENDHILEKTRSISDMIKILKENYGLKSSNSGIRRSLNSNIPYKNKFILKSEPINQSTNQL